jgi:hypothetical protein
MVKGCFEQPFLFERQTHTKLPSRLQMLEDGCDSLQIVQLVSPFGTNNDDFNLTGKKETALRGGSI